MAEVLEVVARFGDDIIDVARIERGGRETYRIGTAPGVDLSVGGMTSFPLVAREATGLVVRAPHGYATSVTDGVTELRLGPVSVTIAPIARRIVRVPRRPFERRFWAYAIPVLALHLGVWGAASQLGPPLERLRAAPAPPILVHVAHVEDELPPPPAAATLAPTPAPGRKSRTPERRAGASTDGAAGGNVGASITKMLGHVDFQQVADADAYDEQAARQREFGGGARFDPCQRFDCHATEKLEHYETVFDGRRAGADYVLPAGDHAFREVRPARIAICPSELCRAHGDIDERALRREVDKLHAAVARCFDDGPQQAGTVRIDLEIDKDGAVAILAAKGLGKTSDCVGDLVRTIAFAEHAMATRARLVIEMAPPTS